MKSHHHTVTVYPQGRVGGPGLLYGGIGLALALAMQLAGLFKQGDARLKQTLSEFTGHGPELDVLTSPWLAIIAGLFCFGVAFAVLDSPAVWRRILLGGTTLLLMLTMVPAFAVWQIYFSPFFPVVALFWAWFCAMMYANHHLMPCDETGKTSAAQAETPGKQQAVESAQQESEPDDEVDPDSKYQPKQLNDGKVPEVDG